MSPSRNLTHITPRRPDATRSRVVCVSRDNGMLFGLQVISGVYLLLLTSPNYVPDLTER